MRLRLLLDRRSNVNKSRLELVRGHRHMCMSVRLLRNRRKIKQGTAYPRGTHGILQGVTIEREIFGPVDGVIAAMRTKKVYGHGKVIAPGSGKHERRVNERSSDIWFQFLGTGNVVEANPCTCGKLNCG